MFTFKSVKMCWNIKKTGEKKKKKRGGNQDKEGKPSRDIRVQGPVLNYCTGESSHTPKASLFYFVSPFFPCHPEGKFLLWLSWHERRKDPPLPLGPGQYVVAL
jgi:hypothetical protein